MLHLITVAGTSARNFFLEQQCIPDFKALMRTITSSRVTIVSTKFRSDLFYCAKKPRHKAILTLWALYANAKSAELKREDYSTSNGDKKTLTNYFQSINTLATHWHQYILYRKAFQFSYTNDRENPIVQTVVKCDRYLIEQCDIRRAPLVDPRQHMISAITRDTFSVAMHTINRETRCN